MEAAPRPWRLVVETDRRGRRSMVVTAADDTVVEHRRAGGFPPEVFAWHLANAARYVRAVNEAAERDRARYVAMRLQAYVASAPRRSWPAELVALIDEARAYGAEEP